tara:strand:- start:1188 stop:2834 length:1647 start_codon:yes stop_codon:yes gene_type:complete
MAVKTKASNRASIDSQPQDINQFLNDAVTEQDGYQFGPRLAFQAIRNMGFTTLNCIFELTDNSVDAEATKIYVTWVKDKKTKLYTLVVKDNGTGVPRDRMIEVFTKLGMDEEYLLTRTGHYGIGVKAALINLLRSGTATITSTHGDYTSTLKITHTEDDRMTKEFDWVDAGNTPTGTTITIPDIKNKLQVETIMRHASVVYYPNSERYNDFELIVNSKSIKFIDPLYKDLNGNTKGKVEWDREFNFMGETLDITGTSFMPDFKMDTHFTASWDKQGGKPHLRNDASGVYFRTPGRYVTTGQKFFPDYTFQRILSNLRLEIQVPKRLFEDMGIGVNKNKIEMDTDNPIYDDLCRVVREICNQHSKAVVKFRGKDISEDDKEVLERVAKKLNKVIGENGREKNITAQVPGLIEKRRRGTTTGTVEPGDGTKPRTPKDTQVGPCPKPKRGKVKNALNISFESMGLGAPMFEYFRHSSSTLQIKLNRDSKWVSGLLQGNEDGMFSALMKVYSFIHAGLKMIETAEIDDEQYLQDQFATLVDNETRLLDKLLK